jgi:hypothetical protein
MMLIRENQYGFVKSWVIQALSIYYGEVRMSMLKKLFLLHRKSSLLGLNQKVDSELSNSDPTMMLCRRNPYTKCIIELIPHG